MTEAEVGMISFDDGGGGQEPRHVDDLQYLEKTEK